MKFDIKSLLTGTTLFVASTSNINAVPPKGISLIDGATVTHPVFGEMKVISHKEDLDFYHQKVKDPNKSLFENEYDEGVLAKNFIKYVLNADSLKQANIPQSDIAKFVEETCYSQAGMAALKVITANYMREYDRIKQFCKEHETELRACYDFSQTDEGKEFYEKERQIFELEEKLKELFYLKTDPHRLSKVKVEISRNDLLNLSEYCQNQQDKDSLEGPLPLSDEIIKSFEWRPYNIRNYFCLECKDELKMLSDLCKEAEQENKNLDFGKREFIELGKMLEDLYRKETKEENEKKFSCIRRFVIPACYFPILYRHFFVKDDLEYSDIGTVNKFLFRALKLENGDKSCVFVQETLSIGLRKETEKIENYHVNSSGKFSAFTGDRYGSLLHELMHFMNAIDCFEAAENAPNISLLTFKSEIIANTGVVSKLKFSKEDIYPKKEKKENEEEEEREESDKELDDEKLGDIRDKLEETLGYLYNNACEAWTMYGIFIRKDKQNPRKYEFYYDPINEADADVECKIINGEKRRVIRTGHFMFDDGNRIDPDDETSPLTIGVLNKKIGIYQFYFDEGETLRNLIDE